MKASQYCWLFFFGAVFGANVFFAIRAKTWDYGLAHSVAAGICAAGMVATIIEGTRQP